MQTLPQVEPQPSSEALLAPTVPPGSMTLMSRSNGSCAQEAEAALTRWSITLGVTGTLRIGRMEHFDSGCCCTAGPARWAAAVCLRRSALLGLRLQTRKLLSGRGVGDGHGVREVRGPRYAVRLLWAAPAGGSSRPGPALG